MVNLRLLFGSLLVLAIFVPVTYGWYRYQRQRTGEALLHRADNAEREQDGKSAAQYLQQYLLLHPDDVDAHVRLAEAYSDNVSTPRAHRRLNALLYRTLGLAPERDDLRLRLAQNLLQTGEFAAAEKEASSLLSSADIDPSEAKRVVALSLYYRARDAGIITFRKAAAELVDALDARPDDVQLAAITAGLLRANPGAFDPGELDAATFADRVMDRMVSTGGNSVDALILRYQYRKLHGLPDAAADLQQAMRLAPERLEVLLLAANEAFSAGGELNQQTAENYLQQAVQLAPQDARAYIALAQLYSASQDVERAHDILRRGLKSVGAESIDLQIVLVSSLLESGQIEDATDVLDDLRKAIRGRLPELASDQRRRLQNQLLLFDARADLARGKIRPAVANLRAVLAGAEAGDATAASAEFVRARMLLAQVMGSLNRWELAAQFWDALADEFSDSAEFSRYAADAYLKSGQPDAAIRNLERHLAISRDSAEALVNLVRAHLMRQLRLPPEQRNWTEFLAAAADAESRAGDRSEIVLARAQYLLSQNDDKGREAAFGLFRASESRFAQEASHWRALALGYQQLEKSSDADRAMSQYESLEPSTSKKALFKSTLLARSGQFDEADDLLVRRSAEVDEPDRSALQLQRGRLLIAAGKPQAAQEVFETAITSTVRDVDLVTAGIEVALLNEDVAAAERWEKILKSLDGADEFQWRYLQARRLLISFADMDSAARQDLSALIDELRSQRPGWSPVVVLAARHAELAGHVEQAIREYQLAIELGDDSIRTVERFVFLLYRAGRYGEADEHLSRLTADRPTSAGVESLAISLAVQRNRITEAIQLAQQTVDQHPNDAIRRVWLANLVALDGDHAKAEELFREAIEKFPADDRVWNGLFTFLVRTQQTEKARDLLDQIPAAEDASEATRHFVAAQRHELLGDTAAAISSYEAAIQREPGNIAARLRLARLLLAANVPAAKRQFEEILRRDPQNGDARRNLAMLLASSGDAAEWSQVEGLLQEAKNETSLSVAANNRLRAVLLLRRGRIRQDRINNHVAARQILIAQMARAANKTEDIDHLLLAGVYEQEAKLREDPISLESAREQLRKLVDRGDPSLNYMTLYIEFLLRHIESLADAVANPVDAEQVREVFVRDAQLRLADLRELLRRQGAEPETLSTLGFQVRLLTAEGRADEAKDVVDEFAARAEQETADDAQRAALYMTVGNLYSSLGHHTTAEAWYRKLMSIAPQTYVLLVKSLAEQGRTRDAAALCLELSDENPSADAAATAARLLTMSSDDEASEVVAQPLIASALEAHGENIDLLMSVAVMHVSRNQSDKAIPLLRKIVELAPNHTLALNNLATLLGERPNQRAQALQYIETAIEVAGRLPALLDTQGTIYALSGDHEQAILSLEEAVAGGATDPRYYFHLASAYQMAGRQQDARQALESARRRGLDSAFLTAHDRELLEKMDQEFAVAPDPSAPVE